MICFCYPDCTPLRGWFNLVQVLNVPENSSSSAPSLFDHSLGWTQRSVQLCGGSRARGNLALPVCVLPAVPEKRGWQTRHEDPTTHPMPQLHFCSTDGQRWGRCWTPNPLRSMVPPCCIGVQPGHPGTSKPPSLCEPAACRGCEWVRFVFKVSRDLRLWLQPRIRLGVGTCTFVCLLFFLVPSSTCTFASSQQQAISTSADLEMKKKLLLDKLLNYLFLLLFYLWTSQFNKI